MSPTPLLSGIRLVPPWSSVERYSTREEQFPPSGEQVEEIAALSSEQMGMTVDAGVIRRSRPRRSPNSGSSNLIIFVPTEGGLPLINIGDLRRNLQQQP